MTEIKSGMGCACVHFDRYECANMRYRRQSQDAGLSSNFEFEPCDCICHDDDDDDRDEEDAALIGEDT